MEKETRIMIIKQIQKDLHDMNGSSWDSEIKASEIIKNLSVAFRNLQDKE